MLLKCIISTYSVFFMWFITESAEFCRQLNWLFWLVLSPLFPYDATNLCPIGGWYGTSIVVMLVVEIKRWRNKIRLLTMRAQWESRHLDGTLQSLRLITFAIGSKLPLFIARMIAFIWTWLVYHRVSNTLPLNLC